MQRKSYEIYRWLDSSAMFNDTYTDTRREVPFGSPAANAWSSQVEGDASLHLPCFDVDREKNFTANDDGYLPSALDAVWLRFPDATWVPSQTEGHYHVYSETPLAWDDYLQRLQQLVDLSIVEEGYLRATRTRGATFVRMVGVRKPETNTDRMLRVQTRYNTDLKLEHSDIVWLFEHATNDITGPF